MVGYCLSADTCRRNIIAEHFLETWQPIPCNKMCDICDGATTNRADNITEYCQAALKILESAKVKEVRLTGLKLVDALMGKGASNIKLPGWKGSASRDRTEMIVAYLMVEGFIKEDFHFTPYTTISYFVSGGRQARDITVRFPNFCDSSKPVKQKTNQNGRTCTSSASDNKKLTSCGKKNGVTKSKGKKRSHVETVDTSSDSDNFDVAEESDGDFNVKKRPKSKKSSGIVISDSD